MAIGLIASIMTVYAGLLVLLFVGQRSMMYFPAGLQGSAEQFGLADAKTLALKTADGQTVVAWYQAAAASKPLFIYLHGNGGTLSIRADWLRALAADGSGFLAIDYRGYGGSTGTPSERGLLLDGDAAYAEVRRLGYAPDRIVVIGESLGSGVAVPLAASHPIRALVLASAFSSAADIAAERYWMFPVRLLMKDKFDSYRLIDRVDVPKLFLYGGDDPVVSLASARKLYEAAPEPKTFIDVPDAGHMVLWRADIVARMKAWLAALPSS